MDCGQTGYRTWDIWVLCKTTTKCATRPTKAGDGEEELICGSNGHVLNSFCLFFIVEPLAIKQDIARVYVCACMRACVHAFGLSGP